MLRALADRLDQEDQEATAKVTRIITKLKDGAILDDEDIEDEIIDLNASLRAVKEAADDLKVNLKPSDQLKVKATKAVARAETEIAKAIRRLKGKRQSTRSGDEFYNSTPKGPNGFQTEFTKEISRNLNRVFDAIPTFDGDLRLYYRFRSEYKTHLGSRTDYSDKEKCSYLQNKLLKGTPKKEVEIYQELSQVWEHLDRRYDRPALFAKEVLKGLKGFKPISAGDMSALNQFYGMLLTANTELTQHGQQREMETSTFANEMFNKLPYSERDIWVQTGHDETTEDLLKFAKRRQSQVATIEANSSASGGGRGGQGAAGGGSGSSGGAKGGKGGSGWSKGAKGTMNNSQNGAGNNQPYQAASNAATGGAGAPRSNGAKKHTYACPTGCGDTRRHGVFQCQKYLHFTLQEKSDFLDKTKICYICLKGPHPVQNCFYANDPRFECQKCHKAHHTETHGSTVNGMVLHTQLSAAATPYCGNGGDLTVAAVANGGSRGGGGASGSGVVVMKVQDVKVHKAPSCLLLWDDGSQVSLITYNYARRAGLKGKPKKMVLTVAGGRTSLMDTHEFTLPLVDRAGNIHQVRLFAMKDITSAIKQVSTGDMKVVRDMFPQISDMSIKNPMGKVDILIGLPHNGLHPKELATVGNLRLYESQFGSGHLIGGKIGNDGHQTDSVTLTATVLKIRQGHFSPMDFLSAEAVGTEVPRRCAFCKNCKECTHKMVSLSWEENAELAIIEEGLTLDEANCKWTAKYPFIISPTIMKDNKKQAEACMVRLEKQLIKKDDLEAFNEQFNDTVERGVFKKLTPKEAAAWGGPINYISFVVAYKNGPHATTPLRICMNSAMKQPGSNKSLNDLLAKGPPALADLFSVSLGHREYVFALAKDLSKFYQRVDADELAQHLRRVVWRGGNLNKEPDVYLTTTVNFGDKPAGCIAITAVRETARRFQEINPEAAWFIRNRTYVDDATAGADSKEDLMAISRGMEAIVARGGFKFKETVMSGDQVEDPDQLRKVLGLRWDTKNDRLLIEVRVNYSGKRKGANIEPDEDLEEIEATMPRVITKRILWRVSMGQYDLLGLVSVFLIRLKLLMRSICQEDGQVADWDDPVHPEVHDSFVEIMKEMKELREVSFPRSIKPTTWRGDKLPTLMVFGDGSTQAYCTLAYARWELEDGSVACRLVAGKTRVAPKNKISVPRLEEAAKRRMACEEENHTSKKGGAETGSSGRHMCGGHHARALHQVQHHPQQTEGLWLCLSVPEQGQEGDNSRPASGLQGGPSGQEWPTPWNPEDVRELPGGGGPAQRGHREARHPDASPQGGLGPAGMQEIPQGGRWPQEGQNEDWPQQDKSTHPGRQQPAGQVVPGMSRPEFGTRFVSHISPRIYYVESVCCRRRQVV
jgi:hypothetical protein